MTEKDNPTYKVTDRRMFNPDGTLREQTEENAPKPEPVKPVEAPRFTVVENTAPAETTGKTIPFESKKRPNPDSPEFLQFLYGLATNAFATLGVIPHPVSGQPEVDLETAKHFIDLLGILQTKTEGNLGPQETQLLTESVRDLRLQYVSISREPQQQQ